MPGPGPYYTCLVDMRHVCAFPRDFALYFSTDHHDGDGGIWLYLGNGTPGDPVSWVSYDDAVLAGEFDHVADRPTGNPIFRDDVQGTGHTETPHVHVVDGTVYMTYHKNGIENTQRTLLATSPDGVLFERIGGSRDSVILRYGADERPGDGHTGYLRWGPNPFPALAARFVGYSLHGGGDDYYSAQWCSQDAVQWDIVDVLQPIEGYAMPDDDMILIWHEFDPASVLPIGNGEYAAICAGGNRASGAVARTTELYEIYLAADGKSLTRCSRKLLPARPGLDDAEELSSPTSLVVDGTRHLLYTGTRDQGSVNTIMSASGPAAPAATSLPAPLAARRRHIVPVVQYSERP